MSNSWSLFEGRPDVKEDQTSTNLFALPQKKQTFQTQPQSSLFDSNQDDKTQSQICSTPAIIQGNIFGGFTQTQIPIQKPAVQMNLEPNIISIKITQHSPYDLINNKNTQSESNGFSEDKLVNPQVQFQLQNSRINNNQFFTLSQNISPAFQSNQQPQSQIIEIPLEPIDRKNLLEDFQNNSFDNQETPQRNKNKQRTYSFDGHSDIQNLEQVVQTSFNISPMKEQMTENDQNFLEAISTSEKKETHIILNNLKEDENEQVNEQFQEDKITIEDQNIQHSPIIPQLQKIISFGISNNQDSNQRALQIIIDNTNHLSVSNNKIYIKVVYCQMDEINQLSYQMKNFFNYDVVQQMVIYIKNKIHQTIFLSEYQFRYLFTLKDQTKFLKICSNTKSLIHQIDERLCVVDQKNENQTLDLLKEEQYYIKQIPPQLQLLKNQTQIFQKANLYQQPQQKSSLQPFKDRINQFQQFYTNQIILLNKRFVSIQEQNESNDSENETYIRNKLNQDLGKFCSQGKKNKPTEYIGYNINSQDISSKLITNQSHSRPIQVRPNQHEYLDEVVTEQLREILKQSRRESLKLSKDDKARENNRQINNLEQSIRSRIMDTHKQIRISNNPQTQYAEFSQVIQQQSGYNVASQLIYQIFSQIKSAQQAEQYSQFLRDYQNNPSIQSVIPNIMPIILPRVLPNLTPTALASQQQQPLQNSKTSSINPELKILQSSVSPQSTNSQSYGFRPGQLQQQSTINQPILNSQNSTRHKYNTRQSDK